MATETINLKDILDYYRSDNKDPVKMARMFQVATDQSASQQQLCRDLRAVDPERRGITPGTVHHYTSILKLPEELQRSLVMKEARAFADVDGHPLPIVELAKPFTDGTLSSPHVEQYVHLAKTNPSWTAAELVSACKGNPPAASPTPTAAPEVIEPSVVRPAAVRDAAEQLWIALDACQWDNTADALLARSLLRRLPPMIEEVI